jgi:hypothetical protein
MSPKWLIAWTILAGLAVLLSTDAIPTHAQEPTPENDANCVSCHEHQYYLYDIGKWFCLCDAPMHCVYCHGGRTDSMVEEVAHEGLVLYPTREHAERCQVCHAEDYMSRVVTFETVAGVSTTPRPISTATAVAPVAQIEEPLAWSLQRIIQLQPWRQVSIGVVLIVLVGVIIFGYRCWKADCLPRTQS